MKKILNRKSNFILALLMMLVFSSMAVSAKTEYFSGTMDYRVLDGSSNNVYYSFEANESLTMSGSVKVYDTTNFGGPAYPTTICCYEKTKSGQGNKICSASVTAKFDGKSYSFSNTGKTINKSDKYYIYCYKVNDDGHNIQVDGTLSTN